MKLVLFDLSQQSDHEDILVNIAIDLYDKLIKECMRAARYGHRGLISFDISTLKPYRWIPKNCEERVMQHLLGRLTDMLCSVDNTTITLKWIPSASEEIVPKITTRDLIDMGIYDTDLYGEILKQLKTAITKKEVSADTVQSQILWVKKRWGKRR